MQFNEYSKGLEVGLFHLYLRYLYDKKKLIDSFPQRAKYFLYV